MSNVSKDRKISNFLTQTTIPNDAFLTFVSGSTNYKISLSDFLNSIGVTGTIVQDGDPTGVPILDTAGSINNIRNIEPGSGILAAVSPQNGVSLAHNFTEDTAGAKIVEDLTVLQPNFRSIIAGDGINISASGGQIQVTATGATASTKTILVSQVSDFPAAVSGVITLQSNTEYKLINDITTSNRFVLGNNTFISNSNSQIMAFEYTGSGNMFTATNVNFQIKDISLIANSGTLFSFSGSGLEQIAFDDCKFVAATMGSFTGFDVLSFSDTFIDITTDGFSFTGSNGVLNVSDINSTNTNGSVLNLGTATFTGISIRTCEANVSGGAFFLNGAAGSANLTAGSVGTLYDCRLFGAGTKLNGITADDDQWIFALNDAVQDTQSTGHLSLVNNATNTVISAVNTPTLVLGTYNTESSRQMAITAGGRITYDGVLPKKFSVAFSTTVTVASGSNKTISLYLAKNGSVIANSKATTIVSSGSNVRVSQVWQVSLANSDYLEIFCENNTDSIDILVSFASFVVSA